MCLKPARLATALGLVLAAGAMASPAFALFGASKPAATAPAAPAASPKASATADDATLRKASPQERAAADRLEPLARATFWAREAKIDPTDAEAGVKLSKALRAIGQFEQAIQAADTVLVTAPNNVEALLEDGRAKIGANQAFYAIETLKRAKTVAPKDWRPVSLLGVALEQSERPGEAKQAFDQALTLSPDNPAVLSNIALYYAEHGDRGQAEAFLRRAVARPDANAQERQNLALLLGLQGKVAEAEPLIRQDLPPEVVAANLAYLRGNNPSPLGAAAPASAPTASPAATAAASPGRNWSAVQSSEVIQ